MLSLCEGLSTRHRQLGGEPWTCIASDGREIPKGKGKEASQRVSDSLGPLYTTSSQGPGSLAVTEQDPGLMSVEEFLYQMFLSFAWVLTACASSLAHRGFP